MQFDPDLDLLLHRFRDGWCHLRGDERGVRYLGAGKPPRHVLPAFWRRQPADMRGSDPCHAPLHLPVLPGACMRSAHDNTTNIVIEPGAAPTKGSCRLRSSRALGAAYEAHQRHALSLGERFQPEVRFSRLTCRAADRPAPPSLTQPGPLTASRRTSSVSVPTVGGHGAGFLVGMRAAPLSLPASPRAGLPSIPEASFPDASETIRGLDRARQFRNPPAYRCAKTGVC